MSCYFRHMGDLFDEAGIEVTAKNRKRLAAFIARTVGDEADHCPQTWAHIKSWRADPARRAALLEALQSFAASDPPPERA